MRDTDTTIWLDSETPMHVDLLRRKVLLVRCKAERAGDIYLPDEVADRASAEPFGAWYTIAGISMDCRHIKREHLGCKVFIDDNNIFGNVWMVGPAQRVVREDWLVENAKFIVGDES